MHPSFFYRAFQSLPCSSVGHIFPLIALIYTDIQRFRVHP